MKIKKIYISSFGGLKDFNLEFDGGLNTVFGENENGKSTVMAFIKMMFYGSDKGSSQISKNIRKRYTPWDGSQMAGSIEFEHGGRNYRLEKIFQKSNSTDKTVLCDIDLGSRQTVSSDIGAKLFGLSSPAFERSLFIGQFGGAESNAAANGEINSKLANFATTGDEDISFNTVYKRLYDSKYALMSAKKVGLLDKNIARKKQLLNEFETAKSGQANIEALKEKSEELRRNLDALQNETAELKEKINSEQDIKNAEKLSEMLRLKGELDELNAGLKLSDGHIIDDLYVSKLEFCIKKSELSSQKLNDLNIKAEMLRNNIDLCEHPSDDISPEKAKELSEKIESVNSECAKLSDSVKEKNSELDRLTSAKNSLLKRRLFILPAIIVGLLLIIGSAVSFFLSHPIYSCAAVGSVLLIASLIMKISLKKRLSANNTAAEDLTESIEKINILLKKHNDENAEREMRLKSIETVLTSNETRIESQKQELKEYEQLIAKESEALDAATDELRGLYSRYKQFSDISDVRAELEGIKAVTAHQREIKQRLNYIVRDVGNISYEEAKEKLAKNTDLHTNSDTDFEDIKRQYDNAVSEMTEKSSELASVLAQIKSEEKNVGDPDAIKSEIQSLTDVIDSQKRFCTAADIAMKVLTDSFAEVRKSYGSTLERRASEIFGELTHGRYDSMEISSDFSIAVSEREKFGSHEIDYLSNGTADQAYLSMRLAMSNLISSDGEPLPLFLDDSLTQYDDKRMQSTVEYLKKYSENQQIIMFTCHNSILCAAENAGANTVKIEK